MRHDLGVLRALLLALALLAAPATAAADPGTLERLAVPTPEGEAGALLYVPSTVEPEDRVPLYVMTHGCATTALEQAQANLHHPVAERERFLVLYTDFAPATHPARCWRWTDPASQVRGSGDPATIAAQVRAVLARRPVDEERVYAMGMSSGAFMTAILAATYPDLFAAAGIMAGGPYRTYACLAADRVARPQAETPLLAQGAFQAMGDRARVVPLIELHGSADATVPPGCGEQAIEQSLRTNNLALTEGESQTAPLALGAQRTRTDTAPGRRPATVRTWLDRAGCVVAERWLISGMGHFWSGGTSDPALAAFTDPAGPSAAEASWRFFERFTREMTSERCAEAAGPPATRCRPRRAFDVRFPRSIVRDHRASVAGRRARVRRKGGRHVVRVDVRGRTTGRVQVRLSGRARDGRRVSVTRKFRPCA